MTKRKQTEEIESIENDIFDCLICATIVQDPKECQGNSKYFYIYLITRMRTFILFLLYR